MTEIETLVPAADPAVERLALVLHDSFVAYHDAYLEVTHRAANRFLNREWDEHQDDNTERLGLHKKGVWKIPRSVAIERGWRIPKAKWIIQIKVTTATR